LPKTSHKAKSLENWLENNLLDFFTGQQLASIATESQPIGLFCLRIHFDQTQLHKHMNLVKFKTRLTKIRDKLLQQLRRQAIIKERGESFELN
jgi:hypothetical protein